MSNRPRKAEGPEREDVRTEDNDEKTFTDPLETVEEALAVCDDGVLRT